MIEGWPVTKSKLENWPNNLDGGSFGIEQVSEMILSFFGPTSTHSSVNIASVAAYLSTRNVIMAQLICGGYARKSTKLFYNSAPKVEQYYLQSITCLANSSHGFAVFIYSRNTIVDTFPFLSHSLFSLYVGAW
jgi:hypothetical protein